MGITEKLARSFNNVAPDISTLHVHYHLRLLVFEEEKNQAGGPPIKMLQGNMPHA